MPIEVTNKFLVASSGAGSDVGLTISVLNIGLLRNMSNADAVLLAAWLLAVSTTDLPEFEALYKEVCNT